MENENTGAIENQETAAVETVETVATEAPETAEVIKGEVGQEQVEGAAQAETPDAGAEPAPDASEQMALDVKFDPEQLEALHSQIADGIAAMRDDFKAQLTEMAEHFDKRIDALANIDPEKLEETLADLNARLARIEGQIKHMV